MYSSSDRRPASCSYRCTVVLIPFLLLLFTRSSIGQFYGLIPEFEFFPDQPEDLFVVDVYACFGDPADCVLAVYGTSNHPLELWYVPDQPVFFNSAAVTATFALSLLRL